MTPSGKFLLSELFKEPSHKITSVRSIRLESTMFDMEKSRADSLISEYNHRKRNFDKMNEDETSSALSQPVKRTFDTSETDFNSYVL
jgi:hypothetical protein